MLKYLYNRLGPMYLSLKLTNLMVRETKAAPNRPPMTPRAVKGINSL